MAGNGDGDLYSRVAQVAKRISTDKSRFTDEIAKLQDLVEEAQRRETEATEEVEKLRQALAAQSTEVDAMKKKANRDMALNNGIQSPHSPSVSKHDLSAAKEEITGLKWVVLHEPEIVCSCRTDISFKSSRRRVLRPPNGRNFWSRRISFCFPRPSNCVR